LLSQRLPLRPAALLAAIAVAASASGCLSHEYQVAKPELVRLAQLPPEARGSVRVVQELGARRGEAVAAEAPAPAADPTWEGDGNAQVWINVNAGPSYHPRGHGHVGGPRVRGGAGPVVRAQPARAGVVPRASGGGDGGGIGAGIAKAVPSSGKAEELAVIAVIVVAVAVLAAVGLAVTEGMRYDGEVAVAPGQILYLDAPSGARAVPVAELTVADAAAARSAVLRDDEGWGLYRLGRAPLDRRGGAFKVDLGGFATLLDRYDVAGFASHIQVGVFPWQRFGLLASWNIAAGSSSEGNVFARHGLALEAQGFPLSLGPVHFGLFAHGGTVLAANQHDEIVGVPAIGGGALIELELTTRLALTFRAGWTGARRVPGDWTPSRSLAVGLAIY
jgi:hypothetical protein